MICNCKPNTTGTQNVFQIKLPRYKQAMHRKTVTKDPFVIFSINYHFQLGQVFLRLKSDFLAQGGEDSPSEKTLEQQAQHKSL